MAKEMSYRQLRDKTKEEKGQEYLDYAVEDNKLQLEADLRETRRSIAKSERKLVELKSAHKLNSRDILKEKDHLESLKMGQAGLSDLIKELFPA